MGKRFLIAPQELKGTLSAFEAAAAIARGVTAAIPDAQLDHCPIADGGAGTVEVLAEAMGPVVWQETTVSDPLGAPVRARWALAEGGRTALLEMSSASGLTLIAPHARAPLAASSRGTGELVRAALEAGCARILLGAGGSATCDGGAGALAALGVRFFDSAGAALAAEPRSLSRLARVDLSQREPRLAGCTLQVLTDVSNPLLGEAGAARVYGPQKGASEEDVEVLERALQALARVAAQTCGRSVDGEPGMGAAGGLSFGLATLAGAQLRSGFDVVAEALGLLRRLEEAEIVVTAEGRVDAQTAYFKGPWALGRLGRMRHKRVVCFAGNVAAPHALTRDAFDEVIAVGDGAVPPDQEHALAQLERSVTRWALRLTR